MAELNYEFHTTLESSIKDWEGTHSPCALAYIMDNTRHCCQTGGCEDWVMYELGKNLI